MNDIENLDIDETKIENPYSKNPFWSNNNQTDDIDLDDFEYEKEVMIYKAKREVLNNIFKIMNFKLERFAFIFLTCCMFFIYALSLICNILCFKEGSINVGNDIMISGSVCFGMGLYTLIELANHSAKFPFRRTKLWKDLCKSIKKNKKQIRKIASELEPPKKGKKIETLEDYLNDE